VGLYEMVVSIGNAKWPHHGTWVNIGSCFPQAIGYFEKSNDA
jgi:hypothetical protein